MREPVIEAVALDPSPADGEAILRILNEDNRRRSGVVDLSAFAVLLKDPDTSDVVGGLWGEDDFSWAFIRFLVVPDQYRGQGLGSALLRRGEEIAKARGRAGVWLNTFDFQAAGFYEKLGYEAFGRLEGHGPGNGQTFFRKRFIP